MVRFSVGDGSSLEGAEAYRVDIAGAESNVAINLARLGLSAGWVSRVPDNPLGRRVACEIRRHGVDLSRVVWAPPEERQSTFFIEFGPSPRGTQVIYDRSGSAFSRLAPDRVDWAYVRGAQWLHLTGITPALGAGPRATVARALQEAAAGGVSCSFDVNYRAKLWPEAEAAAVLTPLLSGVEVLVCALRDAVALFGVPDEPQKAVAALYGRFRPAVAVLTLGERGAVAFDGRYHRREAVTVETVDPIGSGDAFVAGFIAGYREGGLEKGLDYAVGLAALKRTYRGDVIWGTRRELLAMLDQDRTRSVQR